MSRFWTGRLAEPQTLARQIIPSQNLPPHPSPLVIGDLGQRAVYIEQLAAMRLYRGHHNHRPL